MRRIYVSNLPGSATDSDLEVLFSQYGEVGSVKLMGQNTPNDRTSDAPRAAYVEMPDKFAEQAIERLDGHEFRAVELAVGPADGMRWQSGHVLRSISDWFRTSLARRAG